MMVVAVVMVVVSWVRTSCHSIDPDFFVVPSFFVAVVLPSGKQVRTD